MASLKLTQSRSQLRIRRLVVFRFPRIVPGQSVTTNAFTAIGAVTTGEVIVSQSPAAGSIATPRVRYQIVNAVTGRPVTNSITLVGTRTAVLRFVVPAGTFRLRITNVGTGAVAVNGVIIVF
ncbi:hypothetical protein [Cohnella nanjingensis]|uniref:Uncharacterized protein n=1 Tax=Cohnella nanjingensis TaxID=1387779 RepID=A0A7X0RQU4_9BACL|nr:hypothetical protein [Cohnella nanjingensis]MBB6671870.1 hypothetical protein [Cohnella nanjingensis]